MTGCCADCNCFMVLENGLCAWCRPVPGEDQQAKDRRANESLKLLRQAWGLDGDD